MEKFSASDEEFLTVNGILPEAPIFDYHEESGVEISQKDNQSCEYFPPGGYNYDP